MNNTKIPLIVDLDGTLVKSDLLLEGIYAAIHRGFPRVVFLLPLWFLRGKAFLKTQIARHGNVNIAALPYNRPFLAYLKEEFSNGRKIVLATAAARLYADRVAEHIGIFSEVFATGQQTNLSGKKKSDLLCQQYGSKGFDYCGNGWPDTHIFPHARRSILVNAPRMVINAARKVSRVEKVFDDRKHNLYQYIKACRVYQWSKNFLLFIPLITSHQWGAPDILLRVGLGFISFGLCASGGYLFNDLLDLSADRGHPRKRNRPLASGEISIWSASWMMVFMQTAGLIAAAMLNLDFFLLLALYCVISLAYTFYFKIYVLIDVLILAGLYTLRILAGAALAEVSLSFWLFAFSIFLFFSLALIKRCSELFNLSKTSAERTKRRDYTVGDFETLREMGIASGYLAILIAAFYINSPDVTALYSRPRILWLGCPVLFYWISRLWLKTNRGEMLDDPIIFSIKDKGSRVVGLAAFLIILLAI